MQIFGGKKKKHRKSAKIPISQGELPLSRVSGFQTFPGKKKKNLYFFFPKTGKKKNKILENRVSEWR